MFYVYAIYNELNNKIYIGQTEDLKRRLWEHNNPLSDRHDYIRKFKGKWILIYKEEYNDRKEALKRERQLKSYRGREFVKNLIHSSVAQW